MTTVAKALTHASAVTTVAHQAPPAGDFKIMMERVLDSLLPGDAAGPPRLVEAMRYALLAPAKRVRGVLTCLAARQFGGDPAAASTFAGAIEMVHAASLVLDDLPCMDDAALRRGRPTCHRVYGEDTASLAAIGLMNQAFLVVARAHDLPDALKTRLAVALAEAIGPDGLIGGQEQDLRDAHRLQTVGDVEHVHGRKTGVLFALAAEGGTRIAQAREAQIEQMSLFGAKLGLAFQTYDDIIDAQATTEDAGKDVRQDTHKVTAVSLLGTETARGHAGALVAQALEHLSAAGGDLAPTSAFVHGLVDQLATRTLRSGWAE